MAIAVAVCFAGIIGWFVSGAGPSTKPDRSRIVIEDAPPPDIKSQPMLAAGGSPIGAPEGSNFYWEFADRNDPSRRAGLVRAAKGTPGVGGSYILTSPEFLYYTKDGGLVHFTADSGEALFPAEERGTRPESGFFDGHVVVKLFDQPEGGRPVDVASDRATMVGTTSKLTYDGTFGELLAPDDFQIDGDQGRFVGRNARVRVSEARQQLMSAVVDPGAVLTLKPKSKDAKDKPKPTPTPPANPAKPAPSITPAPAPASPPEEPKVAYYQVHSVGGVTVERGPRTIASHEANLWVRLVDGALPEGAMGESFSEPAQTPVEVTSGPSGAATPSGNAAPSSAPSAASGATKPVADPPVTLSFAGPLEVTLLDAQSRELERDDVLVRFQSGDGTAATFHDSDAQADAAGDLIEYAATSGRLALVGTSAKPATLGLAESGTAHGERFDVDLRSGLATAAGSGQLVAKADDTADHAPDSIDATPRVLSWGEGATLGFAVRDGRPTSELQWFKPRGNVLAMDRAGTFQGREMDATFDAVPNIAGKRYLKELILREGTLTDNRDGSLAGSTITAQFEPAGTNSVPTSVAVRGDARAKSGDSTLLAREIDATLIKDERGRVNVDRAIARGDASFAARDGVWAKAELIEASVKDEIVDLTGPDVRLGQAKTSIQGTQMRLEGGDRQRLTVFGAGRFEHEADAARAALANPGVAGAVPDVARASAAWTRQMTFVDREGQLECVGDVAASWSADELSKDTARAERVTMWFTPGKDQSAPGLGEAISRTTQRDEPTPNPAIFVSHDEPSAPVRATDQRRLLRAQAAGSIAQRDDGTRATVESRRFARRDGVEGGPLTLERLLYIEGELIIADDEHGTLRVPGPGKLFSLDHRAAEARVKKAADEAVGPNLLSDTAGARGEAKFEWAGSLLAENATRTITLHKDVKLRHHRAADGLLTDLECQELTAKVAAAPVGDAKDSKARTTDLSGDLRSAMANGKVWLRSGTREITGATLLYDAEHGLVDAMAPTGSSVSVFDQGSAAPMTARRIQWNLTTGRLEVKEPGTIVAPN